MPAVTRTALVKDEARCFFNATCITNDCATQLSEIYIRQAPLSSITKQVLYVVSRLLSLRMTETRVSRMDE